MAVASWWSPSEMCATAKKNVLTTAKTAKTAKKKCPHNCQKNVLTTAKKMPSQPRRAAYLFRHAPSSCANLQNCPLQNISKHSASRELFDCQQKCFSCMTYPQQKLAANIEVICVVSIGCCLIEQKYLTVHTEEGLGGLVFRAAWNTSENDMDTPTV